MVRDSPRRCVLALLIASVLFLAGTAHGDDTTAGWAKYPGNPVLGGNLGTCFDISVLKEDETYRMWL
jgi:beta-1,2-mannobiose phosphorylase / 1,2-beta-oligomannan phosphorylase